MSLITNKVIAKAVMENLQSQSAILQLGAHSTNTSLQGKGVGDTVQLTTWHPSQTGAVEFKKGDTADFEEVSQTSKEVKVAQFVKGAKIFTTDEKFTVSGEDINQVVTKDISNKFLYGVDALAMDELLKTEIAAVDATSGLSSQIILDQIFKHYGERAFDRTSAVVIHPTTALQLMNERNLNFTAVGHKDYGYTPKYRYEIGKIFNKIPVVVSDRVQSEVVGEETIYKNIIVPVDALTYVLAEDLKMESDRDIATQFNHYLGSMIYAMAKTNNGIILNSVAQ